MTNKIRVAIVGVGNCASSLVQGVHYYRRLGEEESVGLMHYDLGGYKVGDIEFATAFDVDARKVGRDLTHAIFAQPNNTQQFFTDIPPQGVEVLMGQVEDGLSYHMVDYDEKVAFRKANHEERSENQITHILREQRVDILVNYLPVGSQRATEVYMRAALQAGVGVVNCIPVFIASDARWAAEFKANQLPIIGDDVKSQVGATIVHRVLADLFKMRGVPIDRTYQLNTGGNTDFLNMLNRHRLASKKESKTEAVQAVLGDQRMDPENIHVGPSDYVPWQHDNKIAFIRLEGRLFGNVPMNLELRLSVEDSPNSTGVVIDAIRLCKLAKDRGQGGPIYSPSAFLMKHPPVQMSDQVSKERIEMFINDQLRGDGIPEELQS